MKLTTRSAIVLALACTLAGAEPGTRNFDATYKPDLAGGPWLCPEEGHGFTVLRGHFSIPWDIKIGQGNDERALTVAHIEGVLPADGETTATSTAVSQIPGEVAHDAKQYRVSLSALSGTTFEVKARHAGDDGEITLTTDLGKGKCPIEFREDPDATPPADPNATTADVDCSQKPYAVDPWNNRHAYSKGAYTQLSDAGTANAVYRCVNGCSVGKGPADNDDTWTLIGHCAAPTSLPADGSPKWDIKYKLALNGAAGGISSGDDWRCPDTVDVPVDLDVSHGKLSMPWNIQVYTHDKSSTVPVGHIDAVVHADGTTALIPVVTVTELPPAIVETGHTYHRRDVTLDHLRAFRPTLTFFAETSMRTSSYGVGRRVEFRSSGEGEGSSCKMDFQSVDFKEQQFKEKDGWKADCGDAERWDSSKSYNSGERASIVSGGVRREFTCQAGSRCDAGVRPDKSSDWSKGLPCK